MVTMWRLWSLFGAFVLVGFALLGPSIGLAGNTDQKAEPELHFFYSETCPHCIKQQSFLDTIEEKYPELTVHRYPVSDPAHHPLMQRLLEEHGALRNFGMVPLTFVGESFFPGFGGVETTGKEIERAITVLLGHAPEPAGTSAPRTFTVPLVGTIDPTGYPLYALALLLGFLDGFNVCSLGALVMIIGLTLKLQRRRAIILFGGTFVVITALTYGALIVLWYQLFATLGTYLGTMKVAIMLLSLGGGLYFLREFLRMQKTGAVCTMAELPLLTRLSDRTMRAFTDKTALLGLLGLVVAFAAVVAMVEFPCSAAVPVAFAALLADAGLTGLGYLSHIALFVFAYMLDELVIFGIAAWRLKLWLSSGAFTKWAVLAEAFILLGIGVWYLLALL